MLLNTLEKRRMRKRQAGMTTLGLIILVAFIALFAFAGLRLTPIYLNYFKVVGVVEGVREEFDGTNASRSAIRSSISRRFDIESVGIITAKDVKVLKVDGGHLGGPLRTLEIVAVGADGLVLGRIGPALGASVPQGFRDIHRCIDGRDQLLLLYEGVGLVLVNLLSGLPLYERSLRILGI